MAKKKTQDIFNIHDRLFKKSLGTPQNTRDFLKLILPVEIKNRLDFKSIQIDPTDYVSDEFKEGFSDIVVIAKMNTAQGKKKIIIYFLLEHKSESDEKVFFQILKYMVYVWEKDIAAKKPLRVIIPIVFYHGKEKWDVPASFVDQFKVDDEIKKFLLDFSYILFDTNTWDFRDSKNREFKDNVFVFTAVSLMKAAFQDDMETIREIFEFWNEKGFTENKKMTLLCLSYIVRTQKIAPEKLKKILDETKIDGGEIMQTIAQQWMREGERKAKRETEQKWKKRENRWKEKEIQWVNKENLLKEEKFEIERKLNEEKFEVERKLNEEKSEVERKLNEEKREMARQMLLDNNPIERVIKYTGISKEEIQSLVN